MKKALALVLLLGVSIFPATAIADVQRPVDFDFEFTYTGPAVIEDNALRWFELALDYYEGDPSEYINYLEFEINGLAHTQPEDLNLLLMDPFGAGLELMDDAGDGFAVADLDLYFTDKGAALPHGVGEGALQAYPPTIYDPDDDGTTFGDQYYGQTFSENSWVLVVIDDAVNDSGSFESATLRGTVVPEPMTLSLLALGAVAALRRKLR